MCRFTIVSTVGLTLATIGSGAAIVTPEQTHAAGLDFWNGSDATAQLQAGAAKGQDLDFALQQAARRNSVGDQIAARLCEGAITPHEALDAAMELAESSPDWFAMLQVHYRSCFDPHHTATDRDLMAQFLRVRIEQTVQTAKLSGDTARASLLSARLAGLNDELQHQPPSPAPRSDR